MGAITFLSEFPPLPSLIEFLSNFLFIYFYLIKTYNYFYINFNLFNSEELIQVYNLLQMIYMRSPEIDNTQNSEMYIYLPAKQTLQNTHYT